jgi:hypothetical protein
MVHYRTSSLLFASHERGRATCSRLAELWPLQFKLRESEYGGDYFLAKDPASHGGSPSKVRVQDNYGGRDEPQEPDVPERTLVYVYFEGTARPDEVIALATAAGLRLVTRGDL